MSKLNDNLRKRVNEAFIILSEIQYLIYILERMDFSAHPNIETVRMLNQFFPDIDFYSESHDGVTIFNMLEKEIQAREMDVKKLFK